MPTTTIQINPRCSRLIVTTSGDPITTLVGRNRGSNVNFLKFTYDDLKMKRKAQVLLYPNDTTLTKVNSYSAIVNKNGYYSRAKLLEFVNKKSQKCPNAVSSSSCSGVVGSNSIYYNDPKVPYFPSI